MLALLRWEFLNNWRFVQKVEGLPIYQVQFTTLVQCLVNNSNCGLLQLDFRSVMKCRNKSKYVPYPP